MSESVALPLMVIFGLATVLLVRSREVRWWEAVLIALFGMYLGQTPALFTADGLVNWFLSGFTRT
ncbi:hypothetical protein GCM10011583_51330 [Streptomyces camponoticapitis]|uniref:Uncharacterized protein n=1 Tax=Streptomyces camponoticapitis TaxID=1616125 RepID=A0ABQ2EID7_9ACTN|nr:hypothetical protein [Streptomyces camponoticapitis]GGK13098.1 hypothetical protein GCM10011583_51330 [Streptomyces camponoticapitis]